MQLLKQGAKKIIFTACHSGKLKPAFTGPDVISTSPKSFLTSRIDFTVLFHSNSSKNITCLPGKLKTEFTSPTVKSTSPGLSDTTFFARCEGGLSIRSVKDHLWLGFKIVSDTKNHSYFCQTPNAKKGNTTNCKRHQTLTKGSCFLKCKN